MKRHQTTEDALRESLRVHGQLVPVYFLGRVIVDGRRRQRVVRELGRKVKETHLPNTRAAARVMWALHPYQAWEEYQDGRTLAEEAEYFGCSLADIATVKSVIRGPRRSDEMRHWSAGYKIRWTKAQAYLARVRQGQTKLTLGGIEEALKLPPFKRKRNH